MHPKGENIRLRTTEKERVLHPLNTRFFRTMKGSIPQRVLQTSANLVSWKEISPDLPTSFASCVQIFSNEAVPSLKGCKLVAYQLHVTLLNFRKENKNRMIQGGHSLVLFSPLEAENSEGVIEADIRGPRELVLGYSTTQPLDAQE